MIKSNSIRIILLTIILSLPLVSQAYPEFISYGYASCLTCHNNGLGGGPLNDYGRALWSTELSSRFFYPKSVSDEQIGNASGFLGATVLARWLRPDIKYRGIGVRTNPGSKQSTSRFYNMQNDLGLTILPDEDGKYLATITWGNMPLPADLGKSNVYRFLAREYYLRLELAQTWWLYAGLMEKAFGLRNIDHTSYQRAVQGFGIYNNNPNGINNSQGLIISKIEDKWEAAVNYFTGNPYDTAAYKQSGTSATTEFEVGQQKRLGLSLMSAKSDALKKTMAAMHYRQALAKGSSLLFEYGLIQDQAPDEAAKTGNYNLVQGMVALGRGYNFKVLAERYVQESNAESPEYWKWAVGILAFPAPRFEFRVDLVQKRTLSNQGANNDAWSIQQQLHISL